ncbi:MAG TPA: hypothetical protein VHB01_09435 [Nitrosospira sp.]|nr:hypothetical protein [Nitrosospira sp.]
MFIFKKVFFFHAFHETACIHRDPPHVIEVVWKTTLAHTGCASAKHFLPELRGRTGQQIDANARQRFQFDLQAAKVEGNTKSCF